MLIAVEAQGATVKRQVLRAYIKTVYSQRIDPTTTDTIFNGTLKLWFYNAQWLKAGRALMSGAQICQ